MAIFQRISDIIKANINDMLDKAEDPEKMVKQIILEMEGQIDQATQGLGQAMASQKIAKKQLDEAKAEVADWENKAKAALAAGNEDLARKALSSKVKLEDNVVKFEAQYDQISSQVELLKSQLQDMKSKLEEARARKNMIIARSKMADASAAVTKTVSSTSVNSAMSKLDKMEEKVMEKESINEAFAEINDPVELDEYAELESKYAVDQELEKLKKEMGID
jgi:phage shock protein A